MRGVGAKGRGGVVLDMGEVLEDGGILWMMGMSSQRFFYVVRASHRWLIIFALHAFSVAVDVNGGIVENRWVRV